MTRGRTNVLRPTGRAESCETSPDGMGIARLLNEYAGQRNNALAACDACCTRRSEVMSKRPTPWTRLGFKYLVVAVGDWRCIAWRRTVASMGLLEIKFQPEISIDRVNIGSHWIKRNRGRIYRSMADYDRVLTKIVTKSPVSDDYYVSAGTGDFVVPWLQRLYRHAEISGAPVPRIRKLVFKCLSIELMDTLLNNRMLAGEFKDRLDANLRGICNDELIRSRGLEIEIRRWTQLPPFHGHMFGDNLLIGAWSIDSTGFLHVQTPVTHFCGKSFSEERAIATKAFSA